jgi:hypothetical protein
MWDYNIPPEDVRAALLGEKEKAGHYDAHGLFKKTIESFPWYIVKEIIPLPRIKELLSDFDLSTLRDKRLAEHYAFIGSELDELISVSCNSTVSVFRSNDDLAKLVPPE